MARIPQGGRASTWLLLMSSLTFLGLSSPAYTPVLRPCLGILLCTFTYVLPPHADRVARPHRVLRYVKSDQPLQACSPVAFSPFSASAAPPHSSSQHPWPAPSLAPTLRYAHSAEGFEVHKIRESAGGSGCQCFGYNHLKCDVTVYAIDGCDAGIQGPREMRRIRLIPIPCSMSFSLSFVDDTTAVGQDQEQGPVHDRGQVPRGRVQHRRRGRPARRAPQDHPVRSHFHRCIEVPRHCICRDGRGDWGLYCISSLSSSL